MPKSRQRKGHRAKVQNYRKRVEDQRRSYEKQMRALYEKQQQENLERQISSTESQVQEAAVDAGIDTGDFKLNDNIDTSTGQVGIIEGITNPDQL